MGEGKGASCVCVCVCVCVRREQQHTWGSAQIDDCPGVLQKPIAAVQLDELERRTGAVPEHEQQWMSIVCIDGRICRFRQEEDVSAVWAHCGGMSRRRTLALWRDGRTYPSDAFHAPSFP